MKKFIYTKAILILSATIIIISCSSDDDNQCEELITERDRQLEIANDNNDNSQASAIRQEFELKLTNAGCQ